MSISVGKRPHEFPSRGRSRPARDQLKSRRAGKSLSRALLIALLPISLLLVACGGDDGSGGSSPTGPGSAIIFTLDRAAGSPAISMQTISGSMPSVLQLEIVVIDLPSFQALNFELAYPIELLRYDGFERGAILGADGRVFAGAATSAVTFEIQRSTPGPVSGTGVLVTVTFSAVGEGQGRLDFVDPVAEDPSGLGIPGIDWIGGTVRVIL